MQICFTLAFITIPISLLQIDGPATPVAVSFVVLLLTYYIHSPIDVHFGPLRKVLVDNRFHRIHHSIEPRHFDKNFGVSFAIWDRWFGTAYDPAPDEWPQVGVEGIDPPRTIRDYLLLPFRADRVEHGADGATSEPRISTSGRCLTPPALGSSLPRS
jgi:sterol desaturase/sphingolipid hydroxylase (fatty acid hydroxylase superfamily)